MFESIGWGVIISIAFLFAKSYLSKPNKENGEGKNFARRFYEFTVAMTDVKKMEIRHVYYFAIVLTILIVCNASVMPPIIPESAKNSVPVEIHNSAGSNLKGILDYKINDSAKNLTTGESVFLQNHISAIGEGSAINADRLKKTVLLRLSAIRKDRPSDSDYFFCDASEFRAVFRETSVTPKEFVEIVAQERDLRCGLVSSEFTRSAMSVNDYVDEKKPEIKEKAPSSKSKYGDVLDKMTPLEKHLVNRISKVSSFSGKDILSLFDAMILFRQELPKNENYMFCSDIEKSFLRDHGDSEGFKAMMKVIDEVSNMHCKNAGIATY